MVLTERNYVNQTMMKIKNQLEKRLSTRKLELMHEIKQKKAAINHKYATLHQKQQIIN